MHSEVGKHNCIELDQCFFFSIEGQDQTASREGGTWLCLNTVQSKLAVLLNLPSRLCGGKNPNAQSRGFLVPNYVNEPQVTLDSYMEALQTTKMNYTGFNFLGFERQDQSKYIYFFRGGIFVQSIFLGNGMRNMPIIFPRNQHLLILIDVCFLFDEQ